MQLDLGTRRRRLRPTAGLVFVRRVCLWKVFPLPDSKVAPVGRGADEAGPPIDRFRTGSRCAREYVIQLAIETSTPRGPGGADRHAAPGR